MKGAVGAVKTLSRGRQIALAGALLSTVSVFMPWHTIGTATLGTAHSFSGFGDQNWIVGTLILAFSLASLIVVGAPLLGLRVPRLPWRESTVLLFCGGEASLLAFVLIVMHATSLVRAANFDIRIGIQLALLGSILIFVGGYLERGSEKIASFGYSAPLARPPRTNANSLDLSQTTAEGEEGENKIDDADRRMKLDI